MVPSDMIAIGDSFSGATDRVSLFEGEPVIARTDVTLLKRNDYQFAQTRHRGCLNLTFCDGYVESFQVHTLYFDEADAAYTRWNRDHKVHRGIPTGTL